MGHIMNFQVVVLAGGSSKNLFPIVSKDLPKALLPVGNRPVLSYVLELLEANNLKDLIVVVAGEDASVVVGNWISAVYHDRLHVKVETVNEDAGTADVLRAVAHHLTADDILVVSGDLICDVPLGAVAAAYRRQRAVMSAVLCKRQSAGSSEGGSGSVGKDKTKHPAPLDIIGLDISHQFILFTAAGAQADKELRLRRSILRVAGKVKIHTDLVDAHLYAFKRTIVQDILDQRPGIRSIKEDLVPYIVRSQLRFAASNLQLKDGKEGPQIVEKSELGNTLASGFLSNLSEMVAEVPCQLKCCAFIASTGKCCARVNSIQAFNDLNRDVAGEAIYLTGFEVSKHNNVIDPTAQLGSKTTVGPHCMLGEGAQLGDKCSVKRSIVGRHCRIGSNVKIMNSVVMDHVTMEDGCHIHGSIICSNAHLQERVTLKDCQVGAGYVISSGTEHKSEALARKEIK